jgi:carbonic anhydrase
MKNKAALLAVAAFVAASASAAESHGHWGYAGNSGASHWADMDANFQTCKLGKLQSPINIETKTVEKAALKPIDFAYSAGAAEVVNNGHTIQVTPAAGGSAAFDGVDYKLLQFHFHTPSEEKINGKAYPMVAHLVHQNADGKLAVVAVLFKVGKRNAALAPIFDKLPAKEGDKRSLEGVNAADLLPADKAYYAFMGSLTTPPCSEEVRWQVMKTPVTISAGQLEAFKKRFKMNARPVQPLNGRVVQESAG